MYNSEIIPVRPQDTNTFVCGLESQNSDFFFKVNI